MSFISAMFGSPKPGKHEFTPESGFPGANGNICCVPDGLGGDSTHLCGKTRDDLIHHLHGCLCYECNKTPQEATIKNLRAQLTAATQDRDRLATENAELKEIVAMGVGRNNALYTENEDLRSRLAEAGEEGDRLQIESAARLSELELCWRHLLERDQDRDRLAGENAALKAELEKAREDARKAWWTVTDTSDSEDAITLAEQRIAAIDAARRPE